MKKDPGCQDLGQSQKGVGTGLGRQQTVGDGTAGEGEEAVRP